MPPSLVFQVVGRLGGYQVGGFLTGACIPGVSVCLAPRGGGAPLPPSSVFQVVGRLGGNQVGVSSLAPVFQVSVFASHLGPKQNSRPANM